jgi:hypothetical protein
MVYPFYSVVCSFVTTITIVYKNFFKNMGNVIVNKMMNNPVSEICSENLSFTGLSK